MRRFWGAGARTTAGATGVITGGVVHGSKGKGTPGGVPGELDQRSCIAAPRLRNPPTKTKANVPSLP